MVIAARAMWGYHSTASKQDSEETTVNCAFQWAQHPNFIYLNVKFSGRIDGPVTVLNVDNENVTLTNEDLFCYGDIKGPIDEETYFN